MLLLLGGCSGAKKITDEPTPPVKDYPPGGTDDLDDPDDETPKFDQGAADVVMKRGAKYAKQCLLSVPSGTVTAEEEVQVVFNGKKGTIVDVKLGPVLSTGSGQFQDCVKNAFIGQMIPPFSGTKTVPFKVDVKNPDKK